jgi:hypothetical protein
MHMSGQPPTEPSVRTLVTELLEDLGYTALEAVDGPAALKVLQSDVRLDLLVINVGPPVGMNGPQVADAGRVARVLGKGHLDPGMQVLTKPFATEALASRIKEPIAET